MKNDTIDFQSLKIIEKHYNPLFQKCWKAVPSTIQFNKSNQNFAHNKKSFCYLVIEQTVEIPQKLFQCKSLCPVFNSENKSFILIKGENLWDFYRAKKSDDIILTEQQIWVMIKQITQALVQLKQFGFFHSHLKEYAIYRESAFCYRLIFHPSVKSMLQLSQQRNFYWYEFYLSPQELNASSVKQYIRSEKQAVFSLGLLILNVMNCEQFHKDVYSKKNYEVDWSIVQWKIRNTNHKYSNKLIDLVSSCLKQFPAQRFGFKQLYHSIISSINQINTLNQQFKSKFDLLISHKLQNQYKNLQISTPKKLQTSLKNSQEKKKHSSNSKNTSRINSKSSSKSKEKNCFSEKQKISPFETGSVKTLKAETQKTTPIKILKEDKIAKSLKNLISSQQQYGLQKLNYGKNQKNKIQQNDKIFQKQIDFGRGTFGGEKDIDYHKNYMKRENKDESNQSKKILENSKKADLLTQKVVEFGLMRSNSLKLINQEVNAPFLDSDIKVLNQTAIQTLESRLNSKDPQLVRKQQNTLRQDQQYNAKQNSLQNLKQRAKNFSEDDIKLIKIKRVLQNLQRKLTLSLKDCLQPLEVLSKTVSQSLGVYINGNIYYGPFKKGRRNGFGLEIFPQNEYYFGNFKDDLFYGEGFYYWNKFQFFLGEWSDGQKVFGHLYGQKLYYFGQFLKCKKMNGYGKAKFKNGIEYVGQWDKGKRDGLGELVEITKDKFIGCWNKGKRDGYGQYLSHNFPEEGTKIKAFWKQQNITSDAIIEYSNGDVYEGGFQAFQKHGKGLLTFKKGGYFKGTFYNDNATHGELLYKNKQKYTGALRNMKRHGFGEYHYLDGTIKKGNWVDNVRIQKQADLIQHK